MKSKSHLSAAWVDFLFCLFLGWLGIHRFRARKYFSGVVYLLSFGLFGLGWAIDTIRYFIAALRGKRLYNTHPKQLDDNGPLPVVDSTLMLSDGEVCHYFGKGSYVKIKNRVVGHSGASGGVSVRIAKGVTYRTGRSAGQPIYGNVADKNDGYLQITNLRIVFSGATASFDKKISNLSSVMLYDDGIMFQFGSDQLLIQTKDGEYIRSLIARIVSG